MTDRSVDTFQAALEQHHLQIDPDQVIALHRYTQLLWKWNDRINLTRHTDFETFVTRDMIDTLQLARHLPLQSRLLDVGAGGGVPGIPLAILRPDLNVSLAESVSKKAKVLETIVRKLKVDVRVFGKRAEDVLKKKQFDVLTIRAVASMRKLLFWLQRSQNSFDHMLMIKGPRWVQEQAEAEDEGLMVNVSCEVIDDYPTPGRDNNSVILKVAFQSNDPSDLSE